MFVVQMLKEPLLFVNQTYCPSEIWTEYQQLSTDKMQASAGAAERILQLPDLGSLCF